MENVQKLLQAFATLLWPLIVVCAIFVFRPALVALIESAKSRKFSIKVGGQEFSFEEANQAQQSLIADLQKQVSDIQATLGASAPVKTPQLLALQAATTRISRILWVDDNPKNNSYFVEQLTRAGITVDQAMSTADAASLFCSRTYDLIISDMGRKEGNTYNPTAGLDLLKLVKPKEPTVPFIVFCSPRATVAYGAEAKELGATAVTSSPTQLVGLLHLPSQA
jgi:CheY-like chemotaxis protein